MIDKTRVGLADAVDAIRQELASARLSGEGSTVKFTVDQVEIELALEVERAGEVGGGVKVWVISADSKVSTASTTTHRITVTMTPIDAAGGKPQISDSQPEMPSR